MNIQELLTIMIERKASDLHISAGEAPMVRVDGDLCRLDYPPLSKEDAKALATEMMNDAQKAKFEEELEIDFSYTIENVARFRVNTFNHFRGAGAAIRHVSMHVPSLEELDLHEPIFKKLCGLKNGLILLTGPTGSGKSTTLAAMVDYINRVSNKREHIITIEDPIEYVFKNENCLIQQREAGLHTLGFSQALRSALREDPDIIMVAEMRDLETIRLALTAAETGHLVFSTLHTNGAAKSIYRIVDAFPTGEKALIRSMLSESLRGSSANLIKKTRRWKAIRDGNHAL
jgi:twitching motility protein PilT